MPFKDKKYRLEYMKKRFHTKRERFIKYLGGKCVVCGATTKLEFDHIFENTKSFEIGDKWDYPWKVIQPELDKCQLLCQFHHLRKTGESQSERLRRVA